MRPYICSLICVAISALSALQVNGQESIVMAFRQDAPPFASSSDGSFSGFAVDLCLSSVERMEDAPIVEFVGVSASTRFDVIDAGTADMLCGPVTITPERLTDYVFSIPFFISGISYATVTPERSSLRDPTMAVVGLLPNTTVFTEAREDLFLEYFGAAGASVFSQLISLRSNDVGQQRFENLRVVDSYSDGFSLLCDGEIQFLLGDVDILATVSTDFELQSDDRCGFTVVRRTITRELYGVLFSQRFISTDFGTSFYSSFQSSLYSLFQDGTAQEIFRDNFPSQSMSTELEGFFRLMSRTPTE